LSQTDLLGDPLQGVQRRVVDLGAGQAEVDAEEIGVRRQRHRPTAEAIDLLETAGRPPPDASEAGLLGTRHGDARQERES
jgi:hypothetical protein